MNVSASVSRVSDTHSSAKKYMWAWGIITPFDSPVVPDVKKIDPRSRASTVGSSAVPPVSSDSQRADAKPAPPRVAAARSHAASSPTR